MIAALFVATSGVYFGRPDVDPWDEKRDARNYRGPGPVVAHPPCSRWCQLAYINQKRYGHQVGDDGGCFSHALACVQRFGGVLEHPAHTYAWRAYWLPTPKRGSWQVCPGGGWVTEVSQAAYGHRARKLTWLYLRTTRKRFAPPELDWSVPAPSAQVSFCKNHGNSPLPRLSKKAAAATPRAFADLLIAIAKSSVTVSSFRGPQGGRRTLNSPTQVRILAPDQLETKEVRPCPNPAVPVRTDDEPPGSTAPGGSCPDGAVQS